MVSVFISLITNFSKNYIFFGKSSVKTVYTHTHTQNVYTFFLKLGLLVVLALIFESFLKNKFWIHTKSR